MVISYHKQKYQQKLEFETWSNEPAESNSYEDLVDIISW